jgi:small subunit ribosomal protein S16
MQRTGRTNVPTYRIVVIEHTRSTKAAAFVEAVGSYDTRGKKRILKADRIKYWISVGAQPSPTVHNMLVAEKIITGKKINVLPKFVAPEAPAEEAKAAPAAEAAAAAEAPAEEAAAPVESAPAEVQS